MRAEIGSIHPIDKYKYKAYDSVGTLSTGELTAMDFESARFKLKGKGLIPISLVKLEDSDASAAFSRLFGYSRPPNLEDLDLFTSRMALLLKNGIKIDRAFDFLINGTTNGKLCYILKRLHDNIRKGEPLSACLEKYSDIFDPLYISIVRVGEATGRLGDAFENIAANLAFRRDILSKTKQALIYPSFILGMCICVIFFLLNFIVPKFHGIFMEAEGLPFYTSMLLGLSAFFKAYQFFFPLLIPAFFFSFKFMQHQDWVKQIKDGLVLKIPLLSGLCITLENLRFSTALSILLSSGVGLSEALEYAVSSINNRNIKKQLSDVKGRVRQGEKLCEAIAGTGVIPEIFEGLIEAGEESASLAQVFTEMKQRLGKDYEAKLSAMVTLVEPLMILVMGVIVGSIVVIMLLSLVSVNDVIL